MNVTGTVGVICEPSDNFPGHGLTDTNPEILNFSFAVGTLAAGFSGIVDPFPADTFAEGVQRQCSDSLDDAEPNTASITCFCLDGGGQPTTIEVSDSDDSNFSCVSPALGLTKECLPQESTGLSTTVNLTSTVAAGFAAVDSCILTDNYFPEDPLCDDGTTGSSVGAPGSPVGPFSLVPGTPRDDQLTIVGVDRQCLQHRHSHVQHHRLGRQADPGHCRG